jgi:hypothetical protein
LLTLWVNDPAKQGCKHRALSSVFSKKFFKFIQISMEMNEFSILSLKDKEDYLKKNGKYIITRDYSDRRIDLYSLKSYFVEIWYHIMNEETKIKVALIDKIEILEDDKDLNVYIELYKRSNYEIS